MRSVTSDPVPGRTTFFVVLFTLALFFSSFFAMVTALPLVYYLMRYPQARFFSVALPALFTIIVVYVVLVPILGPLYDKHPALNWILTIPAMGLRGMVAPSTISTLGIAFFGYYIFLAAVIVSAFAAPERLNSHIAIALAASFLGWCFLVGLVLSTEAGPEGLGGVLMKLIAEAEKVYLEIVKGVEEQNPNLDVTLLHSMRQMSAEAARLIVFLQPGFMFASITSLTVFNVILAKRLFLPLAPRLMTLRLTHFRPPFWLIWMTLSLAALLILNGRFIRHEFLQYVALNVLIAVILMFILQGLAVVALLIETRLPMPLLRLLVYLTIMMFMPPSLLIIGFIGFIDNWLDLRKLDTPIKPKTGVGPGPTGLTPL